ncbi:MAG: hypothetical protein ACFE9D_01180 [Promethearchaeota archaeon]
MNAQSIAEGKQGQFEMDQVKVRLSWRERLYYITLPIFSMVFSLLIAYLVILANPLLQPGIFPPTMDVFQTLLVLFVIGFTGGLATFFTFLIFQRGSERVHRILIAAFVSPLFFILTVFIGQAIFLLLLFQGLSFLHLSLLALASIMFSAFSIVFIFTDALGELARNILFAGYGIILGVFLAVNFTWVISLAILLILAAQDTFFAIRLGPTMIEADRKHHVRTAFTFVIGPLVMGVGDLIVYAALVAYAFRYLGWFFSGLAFVAITIGCLLNTQIVARYPNRAIPGLPVPMICALVPIGIGLFMVVSLGIPIPFVF